MVNGHPLDKGPIQKQRLLAAYQRASDGFFPRISTYSLIHAAGHIMEQYPDAAMALLWDAGLVLGTSSEPFASLHKDKHVPKGMTTPNHPWIERDYEYWPGGLTKIREDIALMIHYINERNFSAVNDIMARLDGTLTSHNLGRTLEAALGMLPEDFGIA